MKWKTLTILTLNIILLGAIPQSKSTTSSLFWLQLDLDKAIAFQYDPQILVIQNAGPFLNGTDAILTINMDSGSLSFLNDAGTWINIWAENCSEGFDISVNGASSITTIQGEGYDYVVTAVLPASTSISISWSWRLESYIDKYTMLGIGATGIVLIFFASIWAALGFKKYGFDIESVSRFDIALIIFLIGVGFIIVWLWR